jgi:16S rRNA (adenine1518-N6/adenine1519-N6)-dimethyltransferase
VRSEETLFRVIRAAFAHRRKVLANALRDEGFDANCVGGALKAAEIEPKRRGETLTLEEFCRVADALGREAIIQRHAGGEAR